MTAPAALRPFSSSGVDSYATCPTQWGMRYGPDRHASPARASLYSDVNRRRGNVLHAAVCTALRAAETELADRTTPLAGATLMRYWQPARLALGAAWNDERMPSDPAEAQLCVDLLTRTLSGVPVPRPGQIHSIEVSRTQTTPGGIEVIYKPDYTYWSAPGVLRVVDWKSGKITEEEVYRHQQLLRYATWLAQADPSIRAVEIELFAMREGRGYWVRVDPVMAARAAARFERLALKARDDRELAPKVGKHCTGCYFRDVCPAFARNADGAAVVSDVEGAA